jgi:peptidoglycan/LPS O-acetylase OafA/YrhL
MSESSPSLKFRPDIEGLRGIAILLVVAFHCGISTLRGGFAGVDVFFVLSGYLITSQLAAELDGTGRLDLAAFYGRRARRLLPAASLVILFTLGVAAWLFSPDEIDFAARAARASSGYATNFFFAVNSEDYFARHAGTNPLLHMWSLAVEEQFYLFWPLLLWLLYRIRPRQASDSQAGVSSRVLPATSTFLAGAVAVVSLVSFGISVWSTRAGSSYAFYGLHTRAWEFGVGALTGLSPWGSWARISRETQPPPWRNVLGFAGLAIILASALKLNGNWGAPGWSVAFPVMATAALLAAGDRISFPGALVLRSKPLVALGGLSYSWYLWHWPLLVLLADFVPGASKTQKVLMCGVALLIAAAVHHWIENPIRFAPVLRRYPSRSVALGAVLAVVCFSASLAGIRFGRHLNDQPELKKLSVDFESIAQTNWRPCGSNYLGPGEARMCEYGDLQSPVSIVMAGDSHAIQWLDAMAAVASDNHWKLGMMFRGQCPLAQVTIPYEIPSRQKTCQDWRRGAMQKILELHPTLVVVAGATSAYVHPGVISPSAWSEGYRKTFEAFTKAGIKFALMRDTPQPGFPVPDCVARTVRNPWLPRGLCSAWRKSATSPEGIAAEDRLLAQFPGAHLIDADDQICDKDFCPATRNGELVYLDLGHMTGRFARTLAPVLEAQLRAILPPADSQRP